MDRLTPPEVALLVEPRAGSVGLCLQAALLTLMSRNLLTLEREGKWINRRFLRLGRGDAASLPRHLGVVLQALQPNAVGGRIEARAAATALRKAFGNDFRAYVHDVLAPPLIGSGLLEREDRRFLGLIPYARYQRTPSGEARVAPVQRILDQAKRLRRTARDEPDRALAIAQAAGILLVLSPAARAAIPRLKQALAQRVGDAPTVAVSAGRSDQERSPGDEWSIETGDFGTVADLDSGLDDIAGVGEFTGGDGGSSDGGDGGGGD